MRENLKATKSFTYAGRALKAGDAFAAASGDARVLRAIGRAETYDTAQAVPLVTKHLSGGDKGNAPEAPARKPRAKKESSK